MPLPLTVSCFSKIQIGFTFLVLAHPGSPGQRAVKRVCVCVYCGGRVILLRVNVCIPCFLTVVKARFGGPILHRCCLIHQVAIA